MKCNYRHAAVTACHQLKAQPCRGCANVISVSTSISFTGLAGWRLTRCVLNHCHLQVLQILSRLPLKTKLIYKLSVYHYWHVGNNCSRSPQSIPSREGALNLISLTWGGNISWKFSFFISRSHSLQGGLLRWCRVTKVKFKYTVINRQQHYRKQDTHFNSPL